MGVDLVAINLVRNDLVRGSHWHKALHFDTGRGGTCHVTTHVINIASDCACTFLSESLAPWDKHSCLLTELHGKYGIKLSAANVVNVLSMLLCATVVSLALSGFVLNTFVAKLGCPWAFNHCFLLYVGSSDWACIGIHWTLVFTCFLRTHFGPSRSYPALG